MVPQRKKWFSKDKSWFSKGDHGLVKNVKKSIDLIRKYWFCKEDHALVKKLCFSKEGHGMI